MAYFCRHVALNGKPLELLSDGSLPKIEPVTHYAGQPLVLPAYTYAFWVFPKANAKACV